MVEVLLVVFQDEDGGNVKRRPAPFQNIVAAKSNQLRIPSYI